MQLPKEMGLPSHFVAKQVRCVYGTRDAGSIWEDVYRAALEDMGFESGVASPCCFVHRARGLSVVVNGDDFTALGTDPELDWYEGQLARHFELKIRGRLGEGCPGDNELRILNRVVKITPEGLTYEADPRHVDLLSQSMALDQANPVVTPGLKDPNPNYESIKEDDMPPITGFGTQADEEYLFSAKAGGAFINALRKQLRQVHFSTTPPDTYEVIPYSEIYGSHPSRLKASPTSLIPVGPHTDPYTSKNGQVMSSRIRQMATPERKKALHLAKIYRSQIVIRQPMPWTHSKPAEPLSAALRETYDRICAVKKKFAGPKRKGAKAVKRMERAADADFLLNREEATLFRALSARANFLSQDRPDISFSTKELCREFSSPNQKSFLRLKRLVRYLVGLPRLVYQFPFPPKGQPPADTINLFVDTDFAGCKETRRSTSGGVALVGGCNIKHLNKTQSTIALSSGEAELNGIGAGIAQGLGVQSICRDLGYDYQLKVHSDATAAIGIARRRGMGRIRHLDTTDLWVQEVVRSGRVELVKVLGSENPADVLTKYVDRVTMSKMLQKMGMRQLEGRAKCAPAIVSQ